MVRTKKFPLKILRLPLLFYRRLVSLAPRLVLLHLVGQGLKARVRISRLPLLTRRELFLLVLGRLSLLFGRLLSGRHGRTSVDRYGLRSHFLRFVRRRGVL